MVVLAGGDVMSEAKRVHIIVNDAPIHCIDVTDGLGERVVRIRPNATGASFKSYNEGQAASLTNDDLHELAAGPEAQRSNGADGAALHPRRLVGDARYLSLRQAGSASSASVALVHARHEPRVRPPMNQPWYEPPEGVEVTEEMARRARNSYRAHNESVANAAVAYCAALAANAEASPPDWMTRLAALDAALHDLQLACGYDPCENDCPGFIARVEVPGA